MHNWLEPISDEVPAGGPVAQRDDYVQLVAEVGKLDAPNGSSIDWAHVLSLVDSVLQQGGKNLLAAVYGAYAQLMVQGGEALADTLFLLREFLQTHWDDMTPTRQRARVGALAWFILRLQTWVQTHGAGEQQDRVVQGFMAFEATVQDRLHEHAPSMRALWDVIQRPAAAAPVAAPAPVAAAPEPECSNLPFSPERVSDDLVRAGQALQAEDPRLADGYRWLRMGLWLDVKQPTIRKDGRSRVPALAGRLRESLEGAAQRQDWPSLLQTSEQALVHQRLCLDLQRYSAEALEGMGHEYAAAHRALRGECKALVTRVPGLMDLLLDDGSPLADAKTRRWFARGQHSGLATPPADMVAPAGERAQFVLQIEAAEACLAAGHAKVALATYRSLMRRAEEHDLARWEPGLAVRCLRGQAVALQQTPNFYPNLRNKVFRELAELDPRSAMELAQKEP